MWHYQALSTEETLLHEVARDSSIIAYAPGERTTLTLTYGSRASAGFREYAYAMSPAWAFSPGENRAGEAAMVDRRGFLGAVAGTVTAASLASGQEETRRNAEQDEAGGTQARDPGSTAAAAEAR